MPETREGDDLNVLAWRLRQVETEIKDHEGRLRVTESNLSDIKADLKTTMTTTTDTKASVFWGFALVITTLFGAVGALAFYLLTHPGRIG